MTREEAIFYLANMNRKYMEKGMSDALEMAIKALEQEPKWIPVSDHAPDYGLDVLVSVDMGSECAVGMDMYSAVEKEGFEGYGKAVLAWMPLPLPYKAESEVQDADCD